MRLHQRLGHILLLVICLLPLNGYAQFSVSKEALQATGKPHALSERLYRRFERIQNLYEKKQLGILYDQLSELVDDYPSDAYVISLAMKMAGYAYLEEAHYDQSARWLREVTSMQALTEPELSRVQYDLAQVYILNAQYSQGAEWLSAWMKQNPTQVSARDHYLLGYAFVQMEKWSQALRSLRTALRKPGKEKKDIQQLMLSCYLKLQDYSAAIVLLKQMLAVYPDETLYWQQLVASYDGINQSDKALATMRIMAVQGVLPKHLRVNYAQRLLQEGNALAAAEVLQAMSQERTLDKAEERLLAQAWSLSGEQAKLISLLQSQWLQQSDDAELLLRLAVLLARQQQWQTGITLLKPVLAASDQRQYDEHRLQLALMYFQQSNYPQSVYWLDTLIHADGVSGSLVKTAKSWQAYVQAFLTDTKNQ